MSLLADYNTETVIITHLGKNASCANGIILKNDKHVLKHGETFEFVVGRYPFKVEFDPPSKNENMGKRKNESEHSNDFGSELKRYCKDRKIAPEATIKLKIAPEATAAVCTSNTWEKIEDGKLYVYTSIGVTSSSKVSC